MHCQLKITGNFFFILKIIYPHFEPTFYFFITLLPYCSSSSIYFGWINLPTLLNSIFCTYPLNLSQSLFSSFPL